jgi:hypothetical protein
MKKPQPPANFWEQVDAIREPVTQPVPEDWFTHKGLRGTLQTIHCRREVTDRPLGCGQKVNLRPQGRRFEASILRYCLIPPLCPRSPCSSLAAPGYPGN